MPPIAPNLTLRRRLLTRYHQLLQHQAQARHRQHQTKKGLGYVNMNWIKGLGIVFTIVSSLIAGSIVIGKYSDKVDKLEISVSEQQELNREIIQRLARIEALIKKHEKD